MTTLVQARGRQRAARVAWAERRWALPAVLLLYVLLGTAWSFVVPLGEGPDEPAHFQYALFLLREGRLPVQGVEPASSDVPGEGHQPPLAYVLMQPWVGWLPPDQRVTELYANPLFRWNGGEQANAYLHGVRDRPPYRGTILAWHLARLWSVALGVASIAVVAATVRQLWPALPSVALGAAALVAFNPQWIFHHALVSNDPPLILLSSVLIYLSVRAAQRTPPAESAELHWWDRGVWRLPLACGATLGLMLVTKQSALAFVPLPLLGLFLGRRSLRSFGRDAVVVLGTATLVAGWWYWRNHSLYGDPLGLHVFQVTFASGEFAYGSWQSWRNGGWNLLRSSWGLFGWMTLPLPAGAFALLRAALVVAVVGLLASAGGDVWRGRGRAGLVLVAAVCLAGAWTVAFAGTAGAVAWQGRFLFPAAPALATLLAIGLDNALPRRVGLWTLATAVLLLSCVLPYSLIRPAYSSPALAADAVPRGALFARFGPPWKLGIELHDATVEGAARPGTTLPIRLTWHVQEPVDRPWYVFLHLVDGDEVIVAKHDGEPFAGRHSTNMWVPGDWYRDEQPLPIVGVEPGTYDLRVGLFDPETGERLGVYDREGTLIGDYVDLGKVRVTNDR